MVLRIFARAERSQGCLMLTYHCPTTGRVVRSDLETSEAEMRRLSALRFSLWCPYCQTGHSIFGKDIKVATDVKRSAA
jgi:cytochrome c-type biogenesis protein CcmH/NrfF